MKPERRRTATKIRGKARVSIWVRRKCVLSRANLEQTRELESREEGAMLWIFEKSDAWGAFIDFRRVCKFGMYEKLDLETFGESGKVI